MNIERNFGATLWRLQWRHHHKKTFFGIIWDHLFISEVRLKPCLIFQNFQNGRHFELATSFFFTESYTGSWIYEKDSHAHFRHFELLIDAPIQILTEIYQFQIWPILWPGDVINDVMNIYLYNCSLNLMIHMHWKFSDDIFASFIVIMKNVVISFIKEYRGPILRRPCDVINDAIILKISFWHNLGRSFHMWGQIEAVLIFQNFQNGRHFEHATNFFTGSYTGSWIYQADSHQHFRHFELLIVAVAQILAEICQFQNLTYFVSLWRHQWRHECVKHNLHN